MASLSHEFSRRHSAPVCEIVELRMQCVDMTRSAQRTRSCVEGSPKPTEPSVFDEYYGARVTVVSKSFLKKDTGSASGHQGADTHTAAGTERQSSVFYDQGQSQSAETETPLKQTGDSSGLKLPNASAASQDLSFLDHAAILDASEGIPDPDLSVVVRRVQH
mmetsp:Transcript_15114/g.35813  ORF Transcript_15114/g.35813 Transcript_15114/m.35813 type:complete len:162 (+) Transcript_15114:90-575(+)